MSIFLEGTNTGGFKVSDAEGKVLIATLNYVKAMKVANEEASRRKDWVAILHGGDLVVPHGAVVLGPGALNHVRITHDRRKKGTK